MWWRDVDATNGCVADAKRAEVLLGVVLALHAGHKAWERSWVRRRQWWREVVVAWHVGCERGRY